MAAVLAGLVGFARVYRGMHHLTDVLAGAVLGVGALAVALTAVRVTGYVSDRQRERRDPAGDSVGRLAMTGVAVVAHQGKSLGGGLDELRTLLTDAGVPNPLWYEVPKSRKAPKQIRRAVKRGADLVFVWGGDGMVQRCADTLAGSGVTIAILPAGTANLLASNLGIPKDLGQAVDIGLHGRSRPLDLGVVNGERFAVMAGAGFDARMIRDADGSLKDHLVGRATCGPAPRRHAGKPTRMKVRVDGTTWFSGKASCVLVGNVGTITGGLNVFTGRRTRRRSPRDRRGHRQGRRAMAPGPRTYGRRSDRAVAAHQLTRGRKITVRFADKTPYEFDGGDRPSTSRLKVSIEPRAISVRVPTVDPS